MKGKSKKYKNTKEMQIYKFRITKELRIGHFEHSDNSHKYYKQWKLDDHYEKSLANKIKFNSLYFIY